MEIRKLNKKELKKFIDSDEFHSMPVIPITKHRALSHLSNPSASGDDVLLLLAFEDQRMIGCLGILPDFLYDREVKFKIGWLSVMWVDPMMRRKGIAGRLIREALGAWNYQVLVADWLPHTFGVYQKSGAFTEFVREGIQANLRFNLREAVAPTTLFSRIILRVADGVLNIFNFLNLYCRNLVLRNDYPPYETSDRIDDECAEFITRWEPFRMFRRSAKDLKWILNYPWVLQKSPECPKPDKRYYFSSVCNEFRYDIIKIRDIRNEMIAFLMLNIRNKSMQIPYLYYYPDHVEAVARFIYRYMFDNKIKGIKLFDTGLSDYILTNRTPFISKQKMKRPYIITKSLAEKLTDEGRIIQDGDGELAFT